MLYIILGIIVFIVMVYFLIHKARGGSESNVKYTAKGDPEAQGKYLNIKFPPSPHISAQDLLELSWQFLYDLTEMVLNKFSVRDQQEIVKHGRVMVEHGAKYQHIVDSNPKVVEAYMKKPTDIKEDIDTVQR